MPEMLYHLAKKVATFSPENITSLVCVCIPTALLCLTQSYRPFENRIVSAHELCGMPFEAIFMISKHEHRTDESDGLHLSAGTATSSDAFDFAGGTTKDHRVPILFPELLRLLPAYYFCPEYLSTLAACSRDVKTEVLNKNHWTGCHLDLERPEFLRDQQTLMAMSRWWRAARTVNLSQHQLAQLGEIPQNCMLRWKAFDLPVHDELCSGYKATHSLLGCARFRISVPDHVRTLRFGIENPRGPEAVYMSIHELFTERMCFSLGPTKSPGFSVRSFGERSCATSGS